ncbi:hypothetical protein ILYODFUR_036544 [Ilyodon furcidens]|uniref:Uncharacterized protein n=1 Tax=Ilyodon furcidens TaxID=33524 RepID=A0ABV0VK43_9TELE
MVAGGIISPGQQKKCLGEKNYREQRNQSVFKEESPLILEPCDSRHCTPHTAAPKPYLRACLCTSIQHGSRRTVVRMRTSLFVCFCVFALQNFQSLVCAPVRGAGRYNAAPHQQEHAVLTLSASPEYLAHAA